MSRTKGSLNKSTLAKQASKGGTYNIKLEKQMKCSNRQLQFKMEKEVLFSHTSDCNIRSTWSIAVWGIN